MSDNPFQPPRAEVGNTAQKPGSVLVAVLLGGSVDLGGTYLVSTAVFIIYASAHGAADLSSYELQTLIQGYVQHVTRYDNVWSWSLLSLGLVCSVFGGYACASRAREKRLKALVIVAVIMAIVGFQSATELELGVKLVLCLISAVAVFQGGRLWAWRHPHYAMKHSP
jgi:hypothetical protein